MKLADSPQIQSFRNTINAQIRTYSKAHEKI